MEGLSVFLLNLSFSHSRLSVLIKGETGLGDTVESCFIEFHGVYSLDTICLKWKSGRMLYSKDKHCYFFNVHEAIDEYYN